MKIQSTPITFIDQTDSRKLEIYIKSNLPTVQIYNQNKSASEAYTPNWTEGEKLILSMDVFLDSRAMTTAEYNGTAIKWYKNDVEMSDGSIEDISDDKRKITIKDNILKDSAIITYTCEATYQGIVASTRITFTRVDAGLNGEKGSDGTSVKILGTASSVAKVTSTNYYTITYSEGAIVAAALGDSYVYNGDLYVCSVLNGDGNNDYFVNVGPIQGEPGQPAKSIVLTGSSQVFKIAKDGKISPSTVTVTAHTVNLIAEQAKNIKWEYRYNASGVWTTITDGASTSDGVIALKDNVATISGSKLSETTMSVVLRATFEDAEDVLTIYKTLDGIDGQKGDTASMAFLTNENTSFPAGADGKTNVLTTFRTNVVAYNGTEKVTPIIGSISDIYDNLPEGMSVVPNKGTAYSKVELTASNAVISDLYSDKDTKNSIDKSKLINGDSFVVGDYLYKYDSANKNFKSNTVTVGDITYLDRIVTNNEITLLFSVPTGKNFGKDGNAVGEITIPVINPVSTNLLLSWTKINAGPEGEPGVGIEHIDVDYGSSKTSNVKVEDITWSKTIPVVPAGEYLWTRTTINYTDSQKQDTVTYTYVQQGKKGDTGTFVDDADIQYAAGSNATTPPSSGWSTAVVAATTDKQYLWTKTIFKLSDGTAGDPVYSVAKQGVDGSNFRTFTTEYETNQTSMETWSKMESSEWNVNESTSGTRAGDTVMLRCYNTTKQGYSYILATVISIPGDKVIHAKSTGLIDKGDPGTGASLVDVTPSALYFKSTTGSAGPFDPQYIYLYPRFQNATYSNWQYSRDGGTTWTSVSGANGLTINTYNSVPYSLRIDRASTLYTNTVTSISFRCNSTNTSVYDTVSIAKIYDVADLQIGGRNLILRSDFKDLTKWMVSNSAWTKSSETYQGSGVMECDVTDREVSVSLYHDMMQTIPYEKLELNVPYTISFYIKCTSNGNRPFTWYLTNITGTSPDNNWTPIIATTEWVKVSRTITFTAKQNDSEPLMYFRAFNGNKVCITKPKFEVGNTLSDWSPAPEDLIEEAANVNVMLSNEAHFFEATAGGVPIDTSVTLDVVGYKGSVKSATTVGTIIGIPSAGMTATVTNNNTTNTKLTIAVTSALTSDMADYGILTIPITVNGHTINKIFNWTKAKAGDVGRPGDDAVTFQVYSNNGYALSTSVPTITLQTFAYIGDVEIKAGATYQWYRHNNTDWVAVSGATNDYFNVSRDDVTFSNNYMCKMQFGGAEYVGVVTIEDKNDENKVFASKPSNYFAGDLWIVGTDYVPTSYTVGTMLRAEHTNTGYTESDWVPATKYDDEIKELKDTVDSYKQYFSVNSTNGLQIGNSSINNDILTIDTINASTVNANSASLESLDIVGRYSGSTMLQAPVMNLGNFSLVIESNGSLSIVANT